MNTHKVKVSESVLEKIKAGEYNTVTVSKAKKKYERKDLILLEADNHLKMGVVIHHRHWVKVKAVRADEEGKLTIEVEQA